MGRSFSVVSKHSLESRPPPPVGGRLSWPRPSSLGSLARRLKGSGREAYMAHVGRRPTPASLFQGFPVIFPAPRGGNPQEAFASAWHQVVSPPKGAFASEGWQPAQAVPASPGCPPRPDSGGGSSRRAPCPTQRASLWLLLCHDELMGEEFPGRLRPPVSLSASRGIPGGGRGWTSPSFSLPTVGQGTGPAFVA